MTDSSWYFKRFLYIVVNTLDGAVEISIKKVAQFINFEAEAKLVELDDVKEDDVVSNFSESSFIDNQALDTDVDFYRQFANVENDIDNVLNEALQDIDQFDEISNLHDGSDNKIEIDEF